MFYDEFFLIIGGGVWPDLKLEVQNLKSFENDANIENVHVCEMLAKKSAFRFLLVLTFW